MKKTSTDLSKYISGIMFVLAILAVVFSSSAEEYKSMIRYDRVWEHVSVRWDDKQVYHVKFDGSEEINGKTYHRLVAFRKASYAFDSDSQPYVFDVDENYYKHEGYLREEDGKVYTLLCNVKCEDGYSGGSLYIPSGDDSHPSDLVEEVLYDFTCKAGESYQGLYGNKDYLGETTYHVTSVETAYIDGEEHRVMRVYTNDWEDWTVPMVEGVGIVHDGCLTTIEFYEMPTWPSGNHIFNRMLSTDGRVLYRAEYAAEIPVGDLSGVDRITATPDTAAPRYDILGRRITEPVPGQLYIQGGKKHIAK